MSLEVHAHGSKPCAPIIKVVVLVGLVVLLIVVICSKNFTSLKLLVKFQGLLGLLFDPLALPESLHFLACGLLIVWELL